MSEDELLAPIARKIITTDDYFDPAPYGEHDPRIIIDGIIGGFTDEEITLIRRLRAEYEAA